MKKITTLFILALTVGLTSGYKTDHTVSLAADQAVVGTAIGNKAPDIVMKDPNGKEIALSSLKGKIVLIDFWSSWCGPCRRENPNIVAAYNKYKSAKMKDSKGFEIFSVSLDYKKDRWVAAITQDKLNWPYHVSDLKGWQAEPARVYGVRSIPTNFLIDANGIIIGKNLRGAQLHVALDKLVESFK